MISKLPRDHYVHVYLEEVRPYQSNVASVEPKMNAEVSVESFEMNVEENIGEPETNDNVSESFDIMVDANSDSEDIDYEVSKSTSYEYGFTDSDNDLEDNVVSKGVGDNVTREESHRPNGKGNDEVRVDNDPESGHSDSSHSLDESGSNGSHKKPKYSKFNSTMDIFNPIFKESSVAQYGGQHQDNSPRASQPPPSIHIVRWMPTPTT
ncbi:hypothetical protein V6N11_018507 [Hibiscus sabdariffa]|uniref:Uncharacterized protein n=1 Tax=Hibiscus sabdariffa TaxID=183260 RepID=A0ABR2T8F5_9ROSI